jgi:putative membrane protein
MGFIWNILLLSVAIFIVAKAMPRIHIESLWTVLIVALVYSILNYLFGWLLAMLSWPFMIITFGLFKLVINAFLLWVSDKLIEDFEIEDIPTTLIAAVLITIADSILRSVF